VRAGLPDRVVTVPDLGDAAENQARLRLLTEYRGYGTRTEIFGDFPDDVRDQLPPELEVLVGSSPAMTRWDCW
jgi:hypothetical protein